MNLKCKLSANSVIIYETPFNFIDACATMSAHVSQHNRAKQGDGTL